MTKNFIIGSDHAGFDLKEQLKGFLDSKEYKYVDVGANSSERTDYPPYAHSVAKSIEDNPAIIGILICGSANGVAMTANKHQGVRCAVCWNEEIAKLSRLHNNANAIAIPARFVSFEEALVMLKVFIETPFEGGRHEQRVNQISCG